ncbi:guanylate kinase [Lacrimispora sp. NSJ-141]|uniref:Guanylate kinase n=1 Tax=Lientehia hominis TaxID=2897778 RepID=A0AAP2RKU7_9FIRM|nr:guanylate kinase [Lientehia hominis]MCD2493551.1 guanylate kinase [Lientehia hominis]
MGKIFYIMGKSACGKDSVFKMLVSDKQLGLRTVTMYTTRPPRDGEEDGREYFFRDAAFLHRMETEEKLIESRTYETACGPWSYFTLDDGQIDLDKHDYVMIGTPDSYEKTKSYFGRKGRSVMIPLYVHVEAGERLMRAVKRERMQAVPQYAELCRRFLADEEDFKKENLDRCGIDRIFENQDLDSCVKKIKTTILEQLT